MSDATFTRIDVAEAAKLWEKHGLTPERYEYLDIDSRCGCLIGVKVVDAVGIEKAEGVIVGEDIHGPAAAATGLRRDYVVGLDYGFTSGPLGRPSDFSPEYRAGVEDGFAVREVVLPTVPGDKE